MPEVTLLEEREEIVNTIVQALDDEDGINEAACNIVLQYTEEKLGRHKAELLRNAIEATEGRFFIYETQVNELFSDLMR